MLATLSSNWKRLKSAVRILFSDYTNFGDFTSSFGRVRLRNVQNARAELFFCPLNILFCHVFVAVARSLISECSSVSYLRRYQSEFNKYLNQHQQKIKSGANSFLHQLLKCAFIVKLSKPCTNILTRQLFFLPITIKFSNHLQTGV